MTEAIPLTEEVRALYTVMRTLPDGRHCGVHRLIYHWTLHVDVHEFGYEDRYCYLTGTGASAALAAWDGTGDPVGWHRHPKSGRRRCMTTGKEWVAP